MGNSESYLTRFGLGGRERGGGETPSLLLPLVRESSTKKVWSGVVVKLIKEPPPTPPWKLQFYEKLLQQLPPWFFAGRGAPALQKPWPPAAAGSFNLDFQRLALGQGPGQEAGAVLRLPRAPPLHPRRERGPPEIWIASQLLLERHWSFFSRPPCHGLLALDFRPRETELVSKLCSASAEHVLRAPAH